MPAAVEINLALILLLPWFGVLAWLYWLFPRQPRDTRRKVFDAAAIVVAFGATVVAMQWSFRHADPVHGGMWPHLLATSVAYGVFLLVMLLALLVRHGWLVRNAVR
jgi:hypothetical protein